MFNLGTGELLIIFLVILLLFGAKKLPELARGLGKGINEFQMNIYDRWGSTIYSTDNIEEGWCGNSNKSSIICPIGKYSFRIDIKDKLGKHHYFIGEVSLVK